VDFRPSPAQQLLVSTAREFLRKRADNDALWRRMAELGWPGLLIPPEFGGSGGSLLDVVLLVEEMGRAAAPGPFVPSAVVATSLLLASGNADHRKRLLPAMAAGERIVGVALVDEGGSFDLDRIALGVEAGRLTGRKLFVEAADVADALVVVARADRDLVLLLVPTDRPGLARFPLDTMGGDKLFEVAFDRVGLDWRKHVVQDPAFLRPAEVDHLIGDASKATGTLGWSPKVSFEQLIEMMVDADLKRLKA